jgi:hypothetical protein
MNEPEYLKLRMESLRDAAGRARLAYIVLTTAALAVMVTAWNSYLSWCDFPAFENVWPEKDGHTLKALAAVHTAQIDKWISSRWLTVGPLGIQIGSDDLAVWGSLGLAMIAIWFLISVRLENHIVAWLLTDTLESDTQLRREIFIGILSRLLFVRVTQTDAPYDRLPAKLAVSEHAPDTSAFYTFFRRSSVWLLFLPAAAITLIIALDVASWHFIASAFNIDHVPIWNKLSGPRQFRAVAMDAFCAFVGIFVTIILIKVRQFEEATRALLRAYWRSLESPGKSDV